MMNFTPDAKHQSVELILKIKIHDTNLYSIYFYIYLEGCVCVCVDIYGLQ